MIVVINCCACLWIITIVFIIVGVVFVSIVGRCLSMIMYVVDIVGVILLTAVSGGGRWNERKERLNQWNNN